MAKPVSTTFLLPVYTACHRQTECVITCCVLCTAEIKQVRLVSHVHLRQSSVFWNESQHYKSRTRKCTPNPGLEEWIQRLGSLKSSTVTSECKVSRTTWNTVFKKLKQEQLSVSKVTAFWCTLGVTYHWEGACGSYPSIYLNPSANSFVLFPFQRRGRFGTSKHWKWMSIKFRSWCWGNQSGI